VSAPLVGCVRDLTATELQVIAAAAVGLGIKETATVTRRSAHTVKQQRHAAMQKLGGRNMPHAVAIAVACGLVVIEVPR